jgi:hypothetical protein
VARWLDRIRGPIGFVVVATVLGCAAWLRLPTGARDTLWAEDGRNFLQDALDRGFAPLLEPYGGYLHVVPRLLAAVVVSFGDAADYALLMTGLSAAVAGVCGALVWWSARQHVRPAFALLIGATTVLAPLAAREVLGNAANLHTLLMWAAFWILLHRPRRLRGSIALAAVILLAALSEVQAVFLLPLVLWRVRDRLRWPICAGYLLGVAAQLAATLSAPRRQTAFGHVDALSYPYGFSINALLPIATLQRDIGPLLAGTGWLVPGALGLLFAALLLFFLWGAPRQISFIALTCVALAVLVYTGSVHANQEDYYDYANHSATQLRSLWFARYGVLPSMLLTAAVLVAAGGRQVGRASRSRQRIAGLAAVLAVISMAAHFVPHDTRRSNGPVWSSQVAHARVACSEPNEKVTLVQTLGWKVRVSCDQLVLE